MLSLVLAGLVATGAFHGGELQIGAASGIVVDAASGQVLWSKDPDTPRYPASTTKILTALLLIERTQPEDQIVAPEDVEEVTGASLHLRPGERVSAGDMLYAIMLRSANDACHAVAKHISGSVEAFAELMNERARQAGARNPLFNNPHGLNDPLHKVSARDLALIAREAMRHPAFNEAVRTRRRAIERSVNREDTLLINGNRWLARDPTADGVKTGWTIPSGQCFVGSATRNGLRLITVVLNSRDWKGDNKAMLDWAFARYEVGWRRRAGAVVARAPVRGGAVREVGAALGEDVQLVRRRGSEAGFDVRATWRDAHLLAPVPIGAPLGVVRVTSPDGFFVDRPVYAANEAPAAVFATAGRGGLGAFFGAGAAAVLGWLLLRRRRLGPKRSVARAPNAGRTARGGAALRRSRRRGRLE
jgi:D-alanyl-D-alanine carboxypeptidase